MIVPNVSNGMTDAILSACKDAVICVDRAGRLTAWNQAAELLFASRHGAGEPRSTQLDLLIRRHLAGEKVDGAEMAIMTPDARLVNVRVGAGLARSEQGEADGAALILRDLSYRDADAMRAREQLEEMRHRTANILANVNAIAAATFRAADPGTLDAFSRRVGALMHAYGDLPSSPTQVNLRDVVEQSLEPFRNDGAPRFDIAGPDTPLRSAKAAIVAMTLNELAANAVKFGALSNGAGRIRINWARDKKESGDLVRLEWREQDGPPVAPPTHSGFGVYVVENGVQADGGAARLKFSPEGVVCMLDIML